MKCSNCGHNIDPSGEDYFCNAEGSYMCERCSESYGEYLDDNADNLAAQERYENFLAEY
jgi:DNA-directed RNA polymerase subunit RPC12/RpoP